MVFPWILLTPPVEILILAGVTLEAAAVSSTAGLDGRIVPSKHVRKGAGVGPMAGETHDHVRTYSHRVTDRDERGSGYGDDGVISAAAGASGAEGVGVFTGGRYPTIYGVSYPGPSLSLDVEFSVTAAAEGRDRVGLYGDKPTSPAGHLLAEVLVMVIGTAGVLPVAILYACNSVRVTAVMARQKAVPFLCSAIRHPICNTGMMPTLDLAELVEAGYHMAAGAAGSPVQVAMNGIEFGRSLKRKMEIAMANVCATAAAYVRFPGSAGQDVIGIG